MYLINEVASILGISRTALLYYIDHQVVQPRTDEQTGYRYFSEKDISTLKYCTVLRNIGMSVKDIAQYLSADDLQQRAEKVARLAQIMQRKIVEQQVYLAAAEKLIEPREVMEEPEIVDCPEYVYCLTGCETGYHFLSKDPVSTKILRSIPVGGFCQIYDDSFYSEDDGQLQYISGRAIRISDALALGIDPSGMEKIGGKRCIHWRMEGSGRQNHLQDVRILRAYMEQRHLRAVSVPFCPDVMAYRPDGRIYKDVYIPIEEE